MTSLISQIIDLLIANYVGIFVLMTMEAASLPIPSEVVMPLAGYISSSGRLYLPLVIVIGTLGSLLGSLVDYLIGYKLGFPFLRKYGKYLMLNQKRLDEAVALFSKYGALIVLISRFVPVLRTVISFPAGIGKMPILKFLGVTSVGNLIWDTILAYVGYAYASSWQQVISVI
jgi:membrane protein DedA with SNARE-associated domain